MHQVTAEYAKNNFNEVIERAGTEPGRVVIVQENKNLVLINQEELDAWVETASLLQDPDLLTDIVEVQEQYQKGEVLTMDQVFDRSCDRLPDYFFKEGTEKNCSTHCPTES